MFNIHIYQTIAVTLMKIILHAMILNRENRIRYCDVHFSKNSYLDSIIFNC